MWKFSSFPYPVTLFFEFFFSIIPISYDQSAQMLLPYSAASAAFPDFFALLRSARFFFVSSFFCST